MLYRNVDDIFDIGPELRMLMILELFLTGEATRREVLGLFLERFPFALCTRMGNAVRTLWWGAEQGR